MTDIERIRSSGEALYGRIWQCQISELLGVDKRRVSHWIAGTRPIPFEVWGRLADELRRRAEHANGLAWELDNMRPKLKTERQSKEVADV